MSFGWFLQRNPSLLWIRFPAIIKSLYPDILQQTMFTIKKRTSVTKKSPTDCCVERNKQKNIPCIFVALAITIHPYWLDHRTKKKKTATAHIKYCQNPSFHLSLLLLLCSFATSVLINDINFVFVKHFNWRDVVSIPKKTNLHHLDPIFKLCHAASYTTNFLSLAHSFGVCGKCSIHVRNK